ncbi:Fc.00g048770.m01.CDS01 [Cosmosporella sp. VM-42]
MNQTSSVKTSQPTPMDPPNNSDSGNASDRASGSPNGKATRSSLACLPCRARHLKCGGEKPNCTRCAEAAKQCQYARSRRGGLDRAALAERRKRLASDQGGSLTGNSVRNSNAQDVIEVQEDQDQEHLSPVIGANTLGDRGLFNGINVNDVMPGSTFPTTPQVHVSNIEADALVDSYYKIFHKFHPLVLPQRHLARLYQDPSRQSSFKPLITVLRFIGHLCSRKEWSAPFQDFVEASFVQASQTHPIMVQCRLLYSIALFWYGHKTEAKREIDAAVKLAISLEMSRAEFAIEHGGGDPVLAESWRRTWWSLYIVDGYYAGTLGTMNFTVVNIEATTELPCEESEYEAGEIPESKTLEDFDSREFTLGGLSFSSFAYLIGAVRCAASAIAATPKIPVKEASPHIIQAADSSIDGWLLLLPKESKQVMAKNGEIDELMFQAHLLIHVALIGLHRPLSDLKFNAVENVSTCARDPPPDTPTPDLINVHTVRVLRSVEAQIRLLALPTRSFSHTPFVTCMVSEGTLALLSACKFLLKGKELAIARDQIRMTIGHLRELGQVWPRTARNVQEIQIIARHVLGLEPKVSNSNTPDSDRVPGLSGGEGQRSHGPGTESSGDDGLLNLDVMDSICGWYCLGDLAPDLSWWVDQQ